MTVGGVSDEEETMEDLLSSRGRARGRGASRRSASGARKRGRGRGVSSEPAVTQDTSASASARGRRGGSTRGRRGNTSAKGSQVKSAPVVEHNADKPLPQAGPSRAAASVQESPPETSVVSTTSSHRSPAVQPDTTTTQDAPPAPPNTTAILHTPPAPPNTRLTRAPRTIRLLLSLRT